MSLFLFLSACGFHLRGLVHFPPNFNQVALINPTHQINRDLILALEIQLKAHQIDIIDDPGQAKYWLILDKDQLDQQITNVAASTAPRQYQLNYHVQFQLIHAHGKPVIEPHTVSVMREVTINSNRILGSNFESQTIEHEMHQDAATQILARISARLCE